MKIKDKESIKPLKHLLLKRKVATMEEMKNALGTTARMSVFRKLKKAGYTTSYSHAGRYYALKETVQYDKRGLWSFGDAYFSKYGTLKETLKVFIDGSEKGYSSFELTTILKVETSRPLWEMHLECSVEREKFDGAYVYYTSQSASKKRRQQLMRKERSDLVADEVKAAIIIFYSLLEEKERRLFSGLESLRVGHGGDAKIAELLELDVHSVAKGRREILESDCNVDRSRKKGGGRWTVKKNAQNRGEH